MGGSFTEAYKSFQLDNTARRFTPSTLHYYEVTLKYAFRWFEAEGVAQVGDVTPALVRRFLASRREAGLSTHTQHKYARALRTFFNYCVREEILSASPMRNVVMPRVEKLLPTSFTEAEVKRIIDECETERDKMTVLLLLDTGMRASELVSLNVGDVDTERNQVLVRHGKGQKQRIVYFGDATRRQVLSYLAERETIDPEAPLMLAERSGKRLTVRGIFHTMRRLREATEIPQLSAHTFRRTFALWSLRAGMSIYHLQRLMGHESLDVLQRYIGLAETDLAGAYAKVRPVDHLLK